MSPHQQARLFLELYKQQMAYFHETRRLELQVNIALWTAIFAVGYALAGKVKPSPVMSTGFIIGTVLLSLVWSLFLKKTKKFDKNLFAAYRSEVERLLGYLPPESKKPIIPWDVWWLFYVIATLIFSLGVMLILNKIPLKM
jgi:hypothetical protein